jgi:hypothetical protein
MTNQPIPVPDPSRQISFHQLLVAARKTWLIDALVEALDRIDPDELGEQLVAYVPKDARRVLLKAGIRDEHVFPMPVTLETSPTLVGYYRLLLGVPQKTFYGGGTGMGIFKSMEMRATMSPRQKSLLPDFCRAMCSALAARSRRLRTPGLM